MCAQYSLHFRAKAAAAVTLPTMAGPGAVMERMAVLVPVQVLMSWSAESVHGGMYQPEGSPPAWLRAIRY